MNKKDEAYNLILQRINDAVYPAQSYIDEKSIAEELGASRTPVREALITLSQEGYLKILPKRGIIVLPFTYQDAMDVFQVRRFLEPWLIREYGPTLTREELAEERRLTIEECGNFEARDLPKCDIMHHPHTLLISKCTNHVINGVFQRLESQSARVPNERRVTRPYVPQVSRDEYTKRHVMLLDLLDAGRFDEAAAAMEAHVEFGRSEYFEYWFS